MCVLSDYDDVVLQVDSETAIVGAQLEVSDAIFLSEIAPTLAEACQRVIVVTVMKAITAFL